MDNQGVEILLVEDNRNDVELTLRAFKSGNVVNRIVVVRDGEEALEYIFCVGRYAANKSNWVPPKTVLLDLKLPKVSGLEVLKRMKADPRTKGIPVVILTASNEERDVVESYQLGVNSYIVKPVDFHKFTEAMKALGVYWLSVNHPATGTGFARAPGA